MENRKIILNKYSLSEIYNIPEIMENEIPFPYNISVNTGKIKLLSPIELRKEEMKDDSIVWVIKTPTLYIWDYDVNQTVRKWNEYVKSTLDIVSKKDVFKFLMLIVILINFSLILIFGSCFNFIIASDIIIITNVAFTIMNKKPLIQHLSNKNTKSIMNKIIYLAKSEYSHYNCRAFHGIIDPIHINTNIKLPKSELESFNDILYKKISLCKDKDLKNDLLEIMNITEEINDYINKSEHSAHELSNIEKYNNDILSILNILNKNSQNEIIDDAKNIIKNYIKIYNHYKKSLFESENINDKAKLEIIKSDVKSQIEYIDIIKGEK